MSMLPNVPLVVLREHLGGPPKVRVDRIRAYLRFRDRRRVLATMRELGVINAEKEKFVPCVICGAQTEFWERARDPRLTICTRHTRKMSGNFPRMAGEGRNMTPPADIAEPLGAARKALYLMERHIGGRAAL